MPAFLKQIVAGVAGRLGYSVIPDWKLDRLGFERHLQRLLPALGIDLVVDVGANEGQYRRRLRREIGYAGDVLSFEPVPALAAALQAEAAGDPRWTVDGAALGAAAGSLMFNIMKDTQFSSFRTPTRDGVLTFEGQNDVAEQVSVAVKTLGDVLPPLGPRRVYLKLDTQGYDLEVLRGAGAALDQVAALQFEACFEPIYDGMPRYDEVIEFARARGFVVSGIFANNPGHFPVLIEADCIMVRQAALPGR